MGITECIVLIIVTCTAALAAHGANWSKLYLSKEGNRFSVHLHINDENIAHISSVMNKKTPVADLLEKEPSFVISEVWNGIDVRVDGVNPEAMVDKGYALSERQEPSTSGAFHSHGVTVRFMRTWTIPDDAVGVTIGFHLFPADRIPMKWLVLAGAPGNLKNSIVRPGGAIEFNFINNDFSKDTNPSNRFLPLWIALGISFSVIAGAAAVYFSIGRRRK
ncbi:MAG: hypothetical protein JW863_20130 [Chitinispirillaceae bacterium]|nr:hypothetical protein [Chitinispirillaceae bacterium]